MDACGVPCFEALVVFERLEFEIEEKVLGSSVFWNAATQMSIIWRLGRVSAILMEILGKSNKEQLQEK